MFVGVGDETELVAKLQNDAIQFGLNYGDHDGL
jgi:hypothetical protein